MPYRYRNVSSFAISVTILLISVIFILSTGQAWADGFDLSVSTSVSGPLTIDLSSLAPPDSDNPYITIQFEIIVDGTVPSTVHVSLKSGEGLYLTGHKLKPWSSQPPFRAEATVKVGRHSKLGDREITITASGDGMEAKTKVSLKLSRETIKISLTEPKADSYFSPGNVKIEGKIDPPLAGVVVQVDIYHRFPELKTPEQIGGWKSGIRQYGMTITKADGSFSIDQKTIAFKHSILGGIPMDIGGGVWYVHFYTWGKKLFGDALKKVDYQRPIRTAYKGVKTFETDYTGVPATAGGDVPAKYVRKLIVREPQIQLEIEGANPLYPQQTIGGNVFRRGLDRPIFEITLTGTTHELVASGIAEIRINLTRPGRAGVDARPIRNALRKEMNYFPLATLKPTMQGKQEVKTKGSTGEVFTQTKSTWIITWDWIGTYGGGVTGSNVEVIPIGIYGIRAELWDIRKNKCLNVTKSKSSDVPGADSFFVIYDFDQKDKWVTETTCKEFGVYPHSEFASWKRDSIFYLHQYDPKIFIDSLKRINYYGGLQPNSKTFSPDVINKPTFNIIDTATVLYIDRANALTYDKNMWSIWVKYDALEVIEQGRTLCSGMSGVTIAYMRAVGIPCRYVTGASYNPGIHLIENDDDITNHAWVEVWDKNTKKWLVYDPTNQARDQTAIDTFAGVIGDGEYGLFYPEKGTTDFYGSYKGYWVVAEKTAGGDPVNLYRRYSYIASIENAKFDAEGRPPSTYGPGDDVTLDFEIKNPGLLDIDSHVKAKISAYFICEEPELNQIVQGYPLDIEVPVGGSKSVSVLHTLPVETAKSPKIRIEVWYPYEYETRKKSHTTVPARMASKDFAIPFELQSGGTIQNTPSVNVGGSTYFMENPQSSLTYSVHEWYDFGPVNVERTIRPIDNISRSDLIEIRGSEDTTVFNLNYPFAKAGNKAFIPGLGLVTSDRMDLNLETNYVVVYAGDGSGEATVHIFSPKITVLSVSFITLGEKKMCQIEASWMESLDKLCEREFLIYSMVTKQGRSSENTLRYATEDACTNGIRFVDMDVLAPKEVFPPSEFKINATFTNDVWIDQRIEFDLEISQAMIYANSTKPLLFQKTQSLIIPAGSSVDLEIPVQIVDSGSAMPWELVYYVQGGAGGKEQLFISYPIMVEIPSETELAPNMPQKLNVTLTNTAHFEIPFVTATINLLNTGRVADEYVDRAIGKFDPGESKTVTWSIEAFSTEYVSLQVSAISGERVVSEEIFHLPVAIPGLIDVEDLTIEVEPAGKRNPKSVGFTLVVRNLGNYPSTYSWVELMLPYGVSGSRRITIGQLAAGAETTISGTLAYNLSEDFIVIMDVADAQGLKSSASIYADMGKPPGSSEFGLYALSPVILLLPVVEVALIFGSKRDRGRQSS